MPYGKRRTVVSRKRYNQLARTHDMEYLKNVLAFCCIADENNKPYLDYCTESDSDQVSSADLDVSPKRVTFAPLPVSVLEKTNKSKRNLKRQIVQRSRRDKEKQQEDREAESKTERTTGEREESSASTANS